MKSLVGLLSFLVFFSFQIGATEVSAENEKIWAAEFIALLGQREVQGPALDLLQENNQVPVCEYHAGDNGCWQQTIYSDCVYNNGANDWGYGRCMPLGKPDMRGNYNCKCRR